jgi:hypothetical protein
VKPELKYMAGLAGAGVSISGALISSALTPRVASAQSVQSTATDDGRAVDEKARAAELAQKLQNPFASLISVPIENDWDFGTGPAEAMTYTASLKPIIPFLLNEDWSLITRAIVPFMYVESPVRGGRRTSGLSDITGSLYFSSNQASGGWNWGVGPGWIVPSAAHASLGSGKWSAGPTAAAFWQDGPWTFGMVSGHAWSFAGDHNRDSVSTTYLQPSLSFTTKGQTTFGVDTTSQYDWVAREWTVPLEISVNQLVNIANAPVQFALTGRWYVDGPRDGPKWGMSFTATFAFPKFE